MQNARNKLSISLETNLNVPESREIFSSLIKSSGVQTENMVWLNELRISDKILLEVNPKPIIRHIGRFGTSGFGDEEKCTNRPSYDPLGQAESGRSLLQGWPDRGPRCAQQHVGDYLSGLSAINGILMAYMNAQRTGKGQSVEISLTEGWMRVVDDNFTLQTEKELLKQRQGIKRITYQSGDVFPIKDGKYINLGPHGKAAYEEVLKGPGTDTKKFSYEKAGGNAEAVANPPGQEPDTTFQKLFLEHTVNEAPEICIANKIGAVVVRDAGDAYEQTHWREGGDWIKYTDQTL